MKVLHVVPSYLPATRYGGPVVSVHALCRALAGAGHEVHVFTTNVDGPRNSDVPVGVPVDLDGVSVHYFGTDALRRLYHSPAMARALRQRAADFDVVHLHSVFLWPTWAAARAARRAGTPYVLAPRGMLEVDLIRRKSRLLKSAWIALIERTNIERASAVHATSEREATELQAFGFRLPRVAVIPNGVDVPRRGIAAEDERAPYILYLGRINWKKGLDRLVASMPHAPGARVIVAGNDEEAYTDALEAQARALGVAERLQFVGPVHGDAKWALYRGARAFALPSYSENFGNVVLEAMACGVPVIVTPEVGAASLVAEAGAGHVVEGAPETLGAAMSSLLADRGGAREMGERGRTFVAERYTWDTVARQVAGMYESILNSRT